MLKLLAYVALNDEAVSCYRATLHNTSDNAADVILGTEDIEPFLLFISVFAVSQKKFKAPRRTKVLILLYLWI